MVHWFCDKIFKLNFFTQNYGLNKIKCIKKVVKTAKYKILDSLHTLYVITLIIDIVYSCLHYLTHCMHVPKQATFTVDLGGNINK